MKEIELLTELLRDLAQPSALLELAVLAACLGLSWAVVARLRPRGAERGDAGIWFGHRGYDGVLFPLLALLLAGLARVVLHRHLPVAVFQLAMPILASLALIRVSVRVLHAAFPSSACPSRGR